MMMVTGVLTLLCLWFYVARTRTKTRERELKDLLALTPTRFEQEMANLLRDLGYSYVEHVGRSNDLGADIKAVCPKGRQTVVQCKRLAPGSKVNSPAVQTFIGMVRIHHQADHGIFVTTADFTAPARELARQHAISLWDGKQLAVALAHIHSKKTAA